MGLSLDKGCSLGDNRVPQEPHTAQEGQSPQVTPNRRHSLLSGVSISSKLSRTPKSIPYHQFYFHLPLPGHRSSPQQLPTCRHTLASALLESPKTWSPPTRTFHGLTWHHSTEHAKARPLTLRSLQRLTWLCPSELSRACPWPPPPKHPPRPSLASPPKEHSPGPRAALQSSCRQGTQSRARSLAVTARSGIGTFGPYAPPWPRACPRMAGTTPDRAHLSWRRHAVHSADPIRPPAAVNPCGCPRVARGPR